MTNTGYDFVDRAGLQAWLRAQSGDITDIITDIISYCSWVSGIILRNSRLNLSDKIGSYISSLRVNSSADSCKQRHEGGSHSVHHHDVAQSRRILDSEEPVEDEEP